MLTFVLTFLGSRAVYHPFSVALQARGLTGPWLAPLPALMALLVTAFCLRLRGQRLADAGLALDGRGLRQATAGAALGTLAMIAIAMLMVVVGGVDFAFDSDASAAALGCAAWAFVWVAVLDEVLFRGFVFQRLVDGAGAGIAQATMAILFAAAHWDNPGMQDATRAWAMLDTALGALILGLAYLRTGRLALPVGLHFGWNWAQGALLGFDVSGFGQSGWLAPQLQAVPEWLTGGAFGPEASVCAVAVDLATLVLLWRWRGTGGRLPATTPPAIAVAQSAASL